ncbi:filamentous hemagglutinin N-terminal domain-containing protein, partial [Rhodoferax sp.]|uniref:filamentous hemagglutinin N-terminal domain-containing protein n=1 Tax=Rhodoferax sp. TaxID=50421 RepID=UPI00271C34DE
MHSSASLNHIYRTVWNQALGVMVAVAEISPNRARTGGAGGSVRATLQRNNAQWLQPAGLSLLALALALTSLPSWALDTAALPTGGQVVAGNASISQAANVLTVQQNTQRAALDWQSFNIGSAARVNFVQPGSSAVALNRIIGNEASQIYGKLNANGQVFFSNPNGMLFARGSQVNVGGILATTMRLGNDDFMAGNYRLSQAGSGLIRTEGGINASGSIALVGNDVQNDGLLFATSITLAAGNTVAMDLTGDGLIRARVEDAALKANIDNSGQMEATTAVTMTAGQARSALDSVVNNTGVVKATGLVLKGGEIQLMGGTTLNTGVLDASSAQGQGGSIKVLGTHVGVSDQASVNASGATGGGTVLVGGDYQGKNPDVPNAQYAYFGPKANIKADALGQGDGGKVIVWADKSTRAYGSISARGGVNGGNGGFVETSGKQSLDFDAKVNVGAVAGLGGTLLLDPSSIYIVGGDLLPLTSITGQILFAENPVATSFVYQNQIEALTPGTHLVLEATDFIRTASSFTGSVLTLPLNSNLSLTTRNASTDGTSNLGIDLTIAGAGISGSAPSLKFKTQGTGSITLQTGTGTSPQVAPIVLPLLQTDTGAISVSASGSIAVNGAISTGGNITMTATGSTTLTGLNTAGNVTVNATDALLSGSNGTATDITATGNVSLTALGIGVAGVPSHYEGTFPSGYYATAVAARPLGVNVGGAFSATTTGASTIAGTVGNTTGDIEVRADANLTLAGVSTDAATTQKVSFSSPVYPATATSMTLATAINGNDDWTIAADGNTVQTGVSIAANTFKSRTLIAAGGLSIHTVGDIGSELAPAYKVGIVAGGVVDLLSDTGNISIDTITTSVTGLGATTPAINVVATNGAINSFGYLTSSVSGAINLSAYGGVHLDPGDNFNTISAIGNVNIQSVIGEVTNDGYGINVTGAAVTLQGSTGVVVDNLTATAGAVTVTNSGGGAVSVGNVSAATDVSLSANGSISANGVISTGGNVSMTANGTASDINVNANIGSTASSPSALTLQAGNDIVFAANAAVSSAAALTTVLNADLDASGSGAIVMNSGSSIASNGGNITLGGGYAGNGSGNAVGNATNENGVSLSGSTLDAAGGHIDIRGTGYAGGTNAAINNDGIYLTTSSQLKTTGSGNITLHGTGGGAGVGQNRGVRLDDTSSLSVVDGAISVTGVGGTSTGTYNVGVFMSSGATFSATGTGGITVHGTGGTGSNSGHGVDIESATTAVTSNTGAIAITGVGGYKGEGLQVVSGADITSTSGDISLSGTSNSGTSSTYGLQLNGAGTLVQTGGNIVLNGTSLNTFSSYNYGITVESGAQVNATGGGTLTATGIGGPAVDYNTGVYVTGSGTQLSVVDGLMTLTGTSGAGTGTYNRGVAVASAAQVKAAGLGGITITGYSDATATSSDGRGVELRSGGVVQTVSGAINITGACGTASAACTSGGTDNNLGFYLTDATTPTGTGAQVLSTSGVINLTGAGWGTGTGNYSVASANGTTQVGGVSATNTIAISSTNSYGSSLDSAAINTSGQVSLSQLVSGTLTQTGGSISAAGLKLSGAAGAFDLQSTANQVTTVAGTVGSLAFVNSAALTVGTVDASIGLTSSGNVTLSTLSGGLTINELIKSGPLGLNLTVGNAGNITLSAAGNIALTKTGLLIDASAETDGLGTTTGNGGHVSLTAGLGISGANSDISSNVEKFQYGSTGAAAGNITLTANSGDIQVRNLNAGTYQNDTGGAIGNAGNVTVTATGDVSVNDITASATGPYFYYPANPTLTTVGNGGAVNLSAGTNVMIAGAIDARAVDPLGTSSTVGNGGNISLKADTTASCLSTSTGCATLSFGGSGSGSVRSSGTGKIDFYYNPVSYAASTNFSANVLNATPYTSWMWVNDVGSTFGTRGLQAMNTNLSGNYALGQNINASATSNWNAGFGFASVGSSSSAPFTGSIFGAGHVISNLTINRPGTDRVGLLGYAAGAKVSNLGLESASITGSGWVGGIAGDASDDSDASGTGGIAITASWVNGTVSGTSFNVGGLVGINSFSGNITSSYTSGGVTGSSANAYNTGGLVGYNAGTLINSYSTAAVSGNNAVGGLVGRNFTGALVSNTYASGLVTATGTNPSFVGGLVGVNSGTVSSSFWDPATTGQASSAAGTALATGQLNQASYTGFDFVNTWWSGEGNTRPFLRSEYSTSISNAHQLQLMALDLTGSYTLARDIDASATNAIANPSGMWGSAGFVPVGDNPDGGGSFTGTLDGANHTVSNLFINRATEDNVALIGYLGGFGSPEGTVRDIHLSNVSVAGAYGVGALVGTANGTVSGASSTGLVDAKWIAGGLVGINSGSISKSSSSTSVTTSVVDVGLPGHKGGLVGNNLSGAVISESFSTGDVTGPSYNGGLVGQNAGSVANSYSSGLVTGTGSATSGGLIGANFGSVDKTFSTGSVTGLGTLNGLLGSNSGTVSSSFWDTTTSGQSASAAGVGLTTTAMHQSSSFSGWASDITSTGGGTATWRIYDGQTAPLLRSFLTPLTLTPLYDGTAQTLGNSFDYSASVASPNTGDIISTDAAGLTLNSSATAGTHTAVLNGFSSTQQGYDISYASRTISGTGSAANSIVIANPLTWTAGDLHVAAVGDVAVNAALEGGVGNNIHLTAEYGAISQTAVIGTTGTLYTSSYGATLLTGANRVGAFEAASTHGAISLTNTAGPLTVTGISQSGGGGVNITNTGSIVGDGLISADGDINIFATVGANDDVTINAGINYTNTTTAGNLDIRANRNVSLGSAAPIQSIGAALNVTLNADRDANSLGSVDIQGYYGSDSINSAGGNITLGGGIDPLTGFAHGVDADGVSVNGTVNAAGGNIVINGSAAVGTAIDYSYVSGVGLSYGSAVQTSGAGRITIKGTASNPLGNANAYTYGVTANDASLVTQSGALTIQGDNTDATGTAYGVGIFSAEGGSTLSTTSGAIQVQGSAVTGTGISQGVAIGSGTTVGTNAVYGQQLTTGDILIRTTSGSALTIEGAVETTGNVTLNAEGGGAITQSTQLYYAYPSITAGGLRVLGDSSTIVTLDGSNVVSILAAELVGATTSMSFSGGAFDIGAITSDAVGAGVSTTTSGINLGTAATNTLQLTAVGDVTQSQTITAGALGLTGAKTFTLTNADNNIGTVAGGSALSPLVGLSLISNTALNVGTVGMASGVAANGNISLSSGSDLAVSQAITATGTGNVALRADANGTGSGTVSFIGGNVVTLNGGRADIYYNPASYTDAATKSDASSNPYSANVSAGGAYTAWMLVNDVGNASGGTRGLQAMGLNLAGNYALGADIDASATATWNSDLAATPTYAGFAPISPFTGKFDGQGHVINNLTINRPGSNNIGLFGGIAAGAVVSNVGLNSVNITGNSLVAGLAGWNDGEISNAFVTGTVTGFTSVAGLAVGNNHAGSLSNSYSSGSVTGNQNVGGLAGVNDSSGGNVSNSYSTASVTGNLNVGGLVGQAYNAGNGVGGAITNAYSTGAVTGVVVASTAANNVGGLVGNNLGATMTNAYSTGAVTGMATNIGGLVGVNTGAVTNGFWDTTTSGQSIGIGGVDAAQAGVTGLATSDMMASANFTSATTANGYVNPAWDFTNTWWMSDGKTRLFLRSEYSTSISNAHQLQLMALDLSASYTLVKDIDASATDSAVNASGMWGSTGFVPVNQTGAVVGRGTFPAFTGTLDGQNHTISQLTIHSAVQDGGLFGTTGTGSVIRNLGLVDVNVSSNYGAGALAANNGGSISNSYVSGGSVTGGNYSGVGGLVGNNNAGGTISNSFAAVSVIGEYSVGGLVGSSAGAVVASYATGSVSGISDVGGLVGWNVEGGTISDSYSSGASVSSGYGGVVGGLVGWNDGSVTRSYSTGKVSISGFSGYGGGLIGQQDLGSVSNSYWDVNTSGKADGLGGTVGMAGTPQTGVTGLTTAALMSTATNLAGFEFGTTWGMVDDVSYPYLQWRFTTPPKIVSGTSFDIFGDPAIVNGTVNLVKDGIVLSSSSLGANGSYYHALDAGSMTSGAVMAHLSNVNGTAVAVRLADGGHLTGTDLVADLLKVSGYFDVQSNTSVPITNADLVGLTGNLDLYTPYTLSEDASNLTVAPGTSFTGNEYDFGGALTATSGSITLTSVDNITLNQVITSSNGGIAVWSEGDVTISGALTAAGQVNVYAGINNVGDAASVNYLGGNINLNAGSAITASHIELHANRGTASETTTGNITQSVGIADTTTGVITPSLNVSQNNTATILAYGAGDVHLSGAINDPSGTVVQIFAGYDAAATSLAVGKTTQYFANSAAKVTFDGTWNAASSPVTVGSAGAIEWNSPANAASFNFLSGAGAGSAGGITLGASGTLTASATGDAISLNAGAGNFVNNAGASALTAASGRWLIYAADPSKASKGGLVSDFRRYETLPIDFVAGVGETGNGMVYANTPDGYVDVTLTSGSATHVYGSGPTAIFGVSVPSIDAQDWSGIALWTHTPLQTDNAGSYNVGYSSGLSTTTSNVFNKTGALSFPALTARVNGGVAYTVDKANLTFSGTRTYDGTSIVDGSVLTATGVGGETFTVTGAGDATNLASKHVQTSQLESLTGLSLGTGSGLSSNYNELSVANSTFTISQLALSGSITGGGNTYGSVVTPGTAGFSNLIVNDVVTPASVTVNTAN